MQKIQSVQNAAARLVKGTRHCDSITPVLQKLHWLPIRRRVEFKLACLVHQSLAGQILTYLTSDILLLTLAALSFGLHLIGCVIPHTHSSVGDRSFSAVGPCVWKTLQSHLWLDAALARGVQTPSHCKDDLWDLYKSNDLSC